MRLFLPLLPDRRAADLLVAMLGSGDASHDAWRRWSEAGDVKRRLGNDALMARPLLPLLYDSVRRNGLPVDAETATYLRSAYVTESLRSRAYREIVDRLTATLQSSGVSFLLVKGAAVGALHYPDPALRHAHDIEIVVDAIEPLRAALSAEPFGPAHDGFVHESGLPLRVHTRLPVAADAVIVMPNGARTLDATAALALALVHASRSLSRQSCRWVCDAHAILRGGGVDWKRFDRLVENARASRPVGKQLRWLREKLKIEN